MGGSPGWGESGPSGGLQLPGDVSQDGSWSITDGIGVLRYLFSGEEGPCFTEEGNAMLIDINGDTRLDVTDAVYILHYLFLRGDPPALGVDCVRMADCPDACVP